jgi:hypothetical protein
MSGRAVGPELVNAGSAVGAGADETSGGSVEAGRVCVDGDDVQAAIAEAAAPAMKARRARAWSFDRS